jgi:hypothetical protein
MTTIVPKRDILDPNDSTVTFFKRGEPVEVWQQITNKKTKRPIAYWVVHPVNHWGTEKFVLFPHEVKVLEDAEAAPAA